jgi:hypothetical protein
MEYLIRPYNNHDFTELNKWWKSTYNTDLPKDLMTNGSFILEINKVPALTLTVLKTQTKELSYLASFMKNPEFKKTSLETYGQILWNHCFDYARACGYKRIICLAEVEQLKSKYERFGMKKTSNNIATFYREL